MVWLCMTAFGQTLQQQQSGPTIELAAGPGMVGPPVAFAVAGQLTTGWWFGPYDDSYGLGRFNAVAVNQRVDWVPRGSGFRYSPQLEFRRGMDLFVVAPHYLIAAGPVLALSSTDAAQVGVAARVGGGLKLRRSRRLGIVGRLAGGVDWIGGRFSPVVVLTLGGGWSSPTRRLR